MSRRAKRKYEKSIILRYNYVDTPDSEKALAEVFDDIFIRITKKHNKKTKENVGVSNMLTKKDKENFIIDNS